MPLSLYIILLKDSAKSLKASSRDSATPYHFCVYLVFRIYHIHGRIIYDDLFHTYIDIHIS